MERQLEALSQTRVYRRGKEDAIAPHPPAFNHERVQRVLPTKQVLICFPKKDIQLWTTKKRILSSLIELMKRDIAPAELIHFHFLPLQNYHKRLLLDFKSADIPLQLLHLSQHLRRYGIILQRVFKEHGVKVLARTKRVNYASIPTLTAGGDWS